MPLLEKKVKNALGRHVFTQSPFSLGKIAAEEQE